MTQYYADSDTNGNIVGYYNDDINGNNIPPTAIKITTVQWQDSISNPGKYIVQNGALVLTPSPTAAQQLTSAQASKIAQIRSMYYQTLSKGFNVTIGITQYTFGWTTDDIAHMNATQTAVSKAYWAFPLKYADINGNPVTIPDQATLDTIEHTASNFMVAQHQQALNLVGQAQAATTTSAVNAIQWSPATY